MPDSLRGVGVGVGVVVAPLVRMGRPPELPATQAVQDRTAEAERARKALAAVGADLAARSHEAKDATAATILDALSMIADDPELTEHVDGLIDDHTAIVARALGLPCVVACAGVMSVPDGTVVAVDAEAGVVELGIDGERQAELRARSQLVEAQLSASTGPGRTRDGHAVALLRNIGSAADLDGAGDDLEGVGLFRTELLFLDRTEPPSFDEQRSAYAAVLGAARGRKVVVRTLDAGADKPLPFLSMAAEPNPALGVRGLRLSRRHPEVVVEQLAALAAAVADVDGAQVWVMAPMVATPDEAAWFAGRARTEGLNTVGVMVEVPAAAVRAPDVLAEVDFLSVGTNDLAQYTFAADRMEGALADLLSPWQPALLELVARCAHAGRAAGKPVGVCGEAAADPFLAPVLAGLGITSLSMSARAVPLVHRALAARTLAECERLADAVVAAKSADAARALATAVGTVASL